MTGRGIDQVLPFPSDPRLEESFVRDAREYVSLAEKFSGPIAKPMGFAEVWGDALTELEESAPAVRLINLETAVTGSGELWPGKGVNYKMSPDNAGILGAAGINAAALANNHVLDWGYRGLEETIKTLRAMKIQVAGAGRSRSEAAAPAVVQASSGSRVLVFAFAVKNSGVPDSWAAQQDAWGVNLLDDLSQAAVTEIREQISRVKREKDIVIASIHWGPNWGYDIPVEEELFAHSLVDEAGIDLIHGHSSHHVKRIEVYRGKLILYGCGDFLNDYEGIAGYEYYNPDLGLMYFPSLDPGSGKLTAVRMTPTRVNGFRIRYASASEARTLADVLNREGKAHGTRVAIDKNDRLHLAWQSLP